MFVCVFCRAIPCGSLPSVARSALRGKVCLSDFCAKVLHLSDICKFCLPFVYRIRKNVNKKKGQTPLFCKSYSRRLRVKVNWTGWPINGTRFAVLVLFSCEPIEFVQRVIQTPRLSLSPCLKSGKVLRFHGEIFLTG